MWVQAAVLSLPRSSLPPRSPGWPREPLTWLQSPLINSQPRLIIVKPNVVALLRIKILPWFLWLSRRKPSHLAKLMPGLWAMGPPNFLSSFPLCAPGLHLVFTRPQHIRLPLCLLPVPLFTPQTDQLLFLKQVQPVLPQGLCTRLFLSLDECPVTHSHGSLLLFLQALHKCHLERPSLITPSK